MSPQVAVGPRPIRRMCAASGAATNRCPSPTALARLRELRQSGEAHQVVGRGNQIARQACPLQATEARASEATSTRFRIC